MHKMKEKVILRMLAKRSCGDLFVILESGYGQSGIIFENQGS
jgi:hypothetical protein